MFENSAVWTKRIVMLFFWMFLVIAVAAAIVGVGLLNSGICIPEAYLLLLCATFLFLASLLTIPLYAFGRFVEDFQGICKRLDGKK